MKIDQTTRQALKSMARKDQTYSEIVKERIVCDAAGCNEAGTNEIHVNAGKFGTVKLFVCPRCVGKFVDEETIGTGPRTKETQSQSQSQIRATDKPRREFEYESSDKQR